MAQKSLEKAGHPYIEGGSKYGFRKITFIPSDTRQASPVNGTMEYDESDDAPVFYNGSSWVSLGVASTAGTGLDGAYDINKTITVDGATITLAGSNVDVLTITQSANDDILVMSKTGAGAGNIIDITNAGTGKDIDGHGSAWYVTKTGAATFTTIAGTDITVTGTQTITTDDTSGVAINIEADSLTTGTAIEVDSNTGAAVTLLDLQNAGTSVFKVGGTGILTLAGVAKDADAIVITDGDITLTDGDLDLTSGQVTVQTDGAGDGMALTDLDGNNYDLLYLNGSTQTGSGHILSIAQGAATRTGHAIDIAMGTTAVAMSAIDIDCSGGTRTVPIVKIDSDGTASDFLHCVTSGIFTGNMINLVQDTGAGTGNFIFINNDSGTSMEAINIDDEVNVADIILVDTAGAIGAGKAVLHIISAGTINATGNAVLVDWSGVTATNTPYMVKLDSNSKDIAALIVDSDAVTDHVVSINCGGALADDKAVLNLSIDGTPAAGIANYLRIDASGATSTNVPTAIEIVGAGETMQGIYSDVDLTSKHAHHFHCGGALTNGLGVVGITNDGDLAAGGNLLNITMGGTPADQTVAAVEIVAAKNCMALDIASSAIASNCVRIVGSGALTNGLAVLGISSAAALAAGGNLLNLTYTGTPADATVSVMDIVCSRDCLVMDIVTSAATTDAVRITGVGAINDNKALLQIAHSTGTVASGGSLIKLTGATAATAGAYGMTIDCSGAGFEALWVEAGTVLVAETLVATGGLSTKVGTTADLTATTPLSTEFDTAFGSANKTRGGFMGIVEDSTDGKNYFVMSDGTTWHFAAMTAAG